MKYEKIKRAALEKMLAKIDESDLTCQSMQISIALGRPEVYPMPMGEVVVEEDDTDEEKSDEEKSDDDKYE